MYRMLTPQCQSSTHKADAVGAPAAVDAREGALSLLTRPTSFTIQEVQTFSGMLGRFYQGILE